jgi:hypothetical protein
MMPHINVVLLQHNLVEKENVRHYFKSSETDQMDLDLF